MSNIKVLWVDDEIDLLKPHIMFLEKRNYHVTKAQSGTEAIEEIKNTPFDIVFLDENMPGLTGLETLAEIKEMNASLPVVMITKSEEEYIMEEAIGSKIADYLIKPVNPNQILLSLKKNLDHSRLISEKTTSNYQQEFRKIAMDLSMVNSFEQWAEMYQKLVYWELELENIEDTGMFEILESQKTEANNFAVVRHTDKMFDTNKWHVAICTYVRAYVRAYIRMVSTLRTYLRMYIRTTKM